MEGLPEKGMNLPQAIVSLTGEIRAKEECR